MTVSYLQAPTHRVTDVGCCLLHCFTGKHQKHRWERSLQIFFLFYFYCLWLLSLHTPTYEWWSNLTGDAYRAVKLWDITLSLQETRLRVSAVPPVSPHGDLYSILLPSGCFRVTNGLKCEQVSAWRDPQYRPPFHQRWLSDDGQDKRAYQAGLITQQPIKICSLYHTICVHYHYQRVRKREGNEWDP